MKELQKDNKFIKKWDYRKSFQQQKCKHYKSFHIMCHDFQRLMHFQPGLCDNCVQKVLSFNMLLLELMTGYHLDFKSFFYDLISKYQSSHSSTRKKRAVLRPQNLRVYYQITNKEKSQTDKYSKNLKYGRGTISLPKNLHSSIWIFHSQSHANF